MRPIFSPAVYHSLQDILSLGLIKKGDGVTFFHDGKVTWHRWPAKEGFRLHGYKALNEDGVDLEYEGAPFGHTGDAHSELSPEEGGTEHGVKGSGHKIEGVWKEGKFGEMMEVDGTGGFHMHGIDGVIHGIGNLLEDIKKQYPQIEGLDDLTMAKQIVQTGINDWNKKNPSNIHPNVNSPELRQIIVSPYDKNNNSLRSPDGKFITLFTNADSSSNHMGTMVESAALKPHAEISNVLTQELTKKLKPFVPEAQNNPDWNWNPSTSGLNFLHDKQGYVYPDHLTYSMNPLTGEVSSRAKHAKKGSITENKFNINEKTKAHYKGAGFNADSAFTDNTAESMIAGGLLHPEYMKEKPTTRGVISYRNRTHGIFKPGGLHGGLFERINRMLPPEYQAITDKRHHLSNIEYTPIDMDDPILDELTWVNTTPETKYESLHNKYVYGTKQKNTTHSLREALESWKEARAPEQSTDSQHSLANDFIETMSSLIGFETLAGNNSRNNKTKRNDDGSVNKFGSQHLRIDDAIEELVGEEGREGVPHLKTADIVNHSSQFAEGIGHAGDGKMGRGMNTHGAAAKRFAHAQVNPNLINEEIPAEIKERHGLTGITTPYTESKVNILNHLARLLVQSKGLEPARHLTDEELLEVQPMHNAQMQDIRNKFPDADYGVPDFAKHSMVSQHINIRGGQTKPVDTPPVTGGAVTGGAVTPPPLKPIITPQGRVQVAPPVGTQGLPSLSPSALQMRQSLMAQPQQGMVGRFVNRLTGNTPDARAASAMRGLGARNPTAENIEQFRQTLSPVQQNNREYQQAMLTDYPIQTSADKLIDMMERLQLTDAFSDENVLKHVPNNNLNKSSNVDVNFMAERLNVTSQDVRTILHAKGDWERIHKTYGYSDTIVKAVKVSFSGGLK